MTERALVWLGSSRNDVRRFPDNVRRVVGQQLRRVQQRREPDHWKPMPSVGLGVREIRVTTEKEHRVLYVASVRDTVCVIHAFEERSAKTSRQDLELARRRLQLYRARR